MKAVILDVRPQELARRKARGEDRRDEMWEGVLHMSPAPSNEHQRILDELVAFLVPLLRRLERGVLRSGINVFRADDDYRIPDLTFVARGREAVLAVDGARGAPDAVIEIRSPGDETIEKLPFYAALGVSEVIVIPRDEKTPEVLRLRAGRYDPVPPDADAMVLAETLGLRFGRAPGPEPRLRVEDARDPTVHVII